MHLPLILMPLVFSFILVIASSINELNKYEDIGHLCLTLLLILASFLQPLISIQRVYNKNPRRKASSRKNQCRKCKIVKQGIICNSRVVYICLLYTSRRVGSYCHFCLSVIAAFRAGGPKGWEGLRALCQDSKGSPWHKLVRCV